MSDDWQVAEGTGWIVLAGFGQISPRRDDVAGGRQYFTPQLDTGEYARVTGESITGGPETWHFEFDMPFFLADYGDRCIEVTISLLQGGRYGVRYRPAVWPIDDSGAW
ncbi:MULTISPECIES: hypothetical protein [unclassified Microbacterium]|uniref:hypothetical protein n=1 Tax=unclassified Microbacterium TaxID=2609290 RepID=UPI00301ABACB